MNEDTFQVLVICAIGLIIVICLLNAFKISSLNYELSTNKCPEMLDTIYRSCMEENNITITTLQGRNVELTRQYDMCIIKT